jgi:ribosomal protein S28E/S33
MLSRGSDVATMQARRGASGLLGSMETAIMGPMRVLPDFLLMQETEREMQKSESARWARRQRSRIQ